MAAVCLVREVARHSGSAHVARVASEPIGDNYIGLECSVYRAFPFAVALEDKSVAEFAAVVALEPAFAAVAAAVETGQTAAGHYSEKMDSVAVAAVAVVAVAVVDIDVDVGGPHP